MNSTLHQGSAFWIPMLTLNGATHRQMVVRHV